MKANKVRKGNKAELENGNKQTPGKATWVATPSKKKLKSGSPFTPSNPQVKSFEKVKKIKNKPAVTASTLKQNVKGAGGLKKSKKEKQALETMENDDSEVSDNSASESSEDEQIMNSPQGKKRKSDEVQKEEKKKQKKLKTPLKNEGELSKDDGDGEKKESPEKKKADKAKEKLSRAERLAEKVKQKGLKDPELLNAVRSRIDDRKDRTLYIKGNLKKQDASDLNKLVPGIVCARKKFKEANFALLEFKTRKLAEKGFTLLKDIKVEDQALLVDFTGNHSKNKPADAKPENELKADPRRLYIGGLPPGTTTEDLTAAFPKASSIRLAKRKTYSNFAHIKFASDEEAQEAFSQSTKLLIRKQPVTVLFAIMTLSRNKKRNSEKNKRRKQNKKAKQQNAESTGNDEEKKPKEIKPEGTENGGVGKKSKKIKSENADTKKIKKIKSASTEDQIVKISKKIKQEVVVSTPMQNKKKEKKNKKIKQEAADTSE